eukprot:NODE_9480_length_339_cov_203.176056.p2 GENE.NODE_9480_length_339_cov_203.176056~~NODE_9480_length_339_cov_203.176056.p2  ORF type:complete len:103 (+),score=31.66 NODE_9480_length_339_cov_203.176056:3-311(+)
MGHANRALMLLRAERHAEAATAAASALAHNLGNSKAAYRRALALLELPGCADEALVAAERAAELEPTDVKVAELLQRARARAAEPEAEPPEASAALALDTMD